MLRGEILKWAESGRLKPRDTPRALEIAGVTPTATQWACFVSALLLWGGMVFVAAGIIFFFAYNWQSLSRFAKFGIAEALLACAVIAAALTGVDRPVGKAATVGASLLTGALLALVGQTYQTGADPFELFAYWAVLILPWVILARFAPLWLIWIGLLNLAAGLYFQARSWGLLGVLFGTSGTLWTLLAINAVCLIAWEAGLALRMPWLHRWGARIIATLAGANVTALGVMAVVESRHVGGWALLVYVAWLAAMYGYYRRRVFDVFMLSGAILSAIVVITALLSNSMLQRLDAGALLFIGLVIIGLSGAGAWWIHSILREEAA